MLAHFLLRPLVQRAAMHCRLEQREAEVRKDSLTIATCDELLTAVQQPTTTVLRYPSDELHIGSSIII